MLRTNLSTRPFYNERAVQVLLLAVGGLALVVLAIGGLRLSTLVSTHAALLADAQERAARAETLRAEAAELQRELGGQSVDGLMEAAGEANRLIDQRVFSWTQFFNVIEATIPGDVMLTSLRPDTDGDVVRIAIGIVGESQDAINAFVERLETATGFSDVLVREEEIIEGGGYRAVLDGAYVGEEPAV